MKKVTKSHFIALAALAIAAALAYGVGVTKCGTVENQSFSVIAAIFLVIGAGIPMVDAIIKLLAVSIGKTKIGEVSTHLIVDFLIAIVAIPIAYSYQLTTCVA